MTAVVPVLPCATLSQRAVPATVFLRLFAVSPAVERYSVFKVLRNTVLREFPYQIRFCRRKEKAPYKTNQDGYCYPISIQFRTVLGGFSVLTEPAPLARFEIVVYIIQFSKRFRADFLCQQQSVRCLCAMSVFCGDRSTMESSALA